MVKSYIEFITESSSNSIVDMLRFFAEQSSGYQRDYFNKKLESVKHVKCTSVYELFDASTINILKRNGRFKKKECYSNALHTAQILESFDEITLNIDGKTYGLEDIKYVEGYMTLYGSFPIDHAFNKIGDYYFDVTAELVLKDISFDDYYSIGEWNSDEALRIMAKTGYYGGVFDTIFRNSIKEDVKDAKIV